MSKGKDPYYALTPEVIGNLELSLAKFFDQWKAALISSLKAVESLGTLIEELNRQDAQYMQDQECWENEGGALDDRRWLCADA